MPVQIFCGALKISYETVRFSDGASNIKVWRSDSE